MVIDEMAAPPGVAEKTAVPVEFDERLTVSATVVGFPNATCSWTVMGPMLAVAEAIAAVGLEVMTNAEGAAGATVKAALVAVVNPLSLAERVYVPTSLSEQPAKVTTPLNWVAEQFDKAAPLGPLPIDRVTEANALVTMLLLASSTATTGWKPNGVPTVEVALVGEEMNAKWVAVPGVGMARAKGSSTRSEEH